MVIQSALHGDGIRINQVEIVRPGVAFKWEPGATGLKIETNLTPDVINNRTEKPIIFSNEAEVWGWARRISHMRID